MGVLTFVQMKANRAITYYTKKKYSELFYGKFPILFCLLYQNNVMTGSKQKNQKPSP